MKLLIILTLGLMAVPGSLVAWLLVLIIRDTIRDLRNYHGRR